MLTRTELQRVLTFTVLLHRNGNYVIYNTIAVYAVGKSTKTSAVISGIIFP
jgi:hypothetical protein